jgi:hypothetical protein
MLKCMVTMCWSDMYHLLPCHMLHQIQNSVHHQCLLTSLSVPLHLYISHIQHFVHVHEVQIFILCFVERASLYNLVCKTNLLHNLFSIFINLYMFWATMCPSSGETAVFMRHLVPDSHPYRIISTKCHINTVVSPDDAHIVAQNM